MQIALGKLGPRQVSVVDRPCEAEGSVESVRVLKIRVFLIIENRLLRDTLGRLLRRQGDVELSGKSGSGETNPEEVAKSGCDVALWDFLDPAWMSVFSWQCLLTKDASAADVTAAVRAVARGEVSCPPQMFTVLFKAVEQMERDGPPKNPAGKIGLTLRQQKLMKLVARGLTTKEIAGELHLSQYTVKNHMSRILKQLAAENRSDAVEAVRERGYEMSL